MAQADLNVANQSGAAFRSDLNGQLLALGTLQSGASAPSTTFAYMLWADTTTGLLKLRDASNASWITVGMLSSTNLGLATLASPTFTGTVGIPLGSASAPTITFTGNTNTGIYSPGTNQVAISTNGTGRLFVDSSGNIGINTSPSSLGSSVTTLEIKGGSTTRTGGVRLSSSDSSAKGAFYIYDGAGILGTETSHPLGFYIANTERMRLDTTGNFGINTSPSSLGSSVTTLEIKGGSATRTGGLRLSSSDSSAKGAFYIYDGAGILGTETNHPLGFYIANTERMRLDTNGFTKHADNGSYIGGNFHEFNNSTNDDVLRVRATNASYTSSCITPSTNLAAGTSSYFIYGTANAVNTFQVLNNGNVKNTNNSYTAISDQKLKENIADAKSQWADIKALRIVNFKFKQETGLETYKQIGLIAQEVETISPGLVDETPEFKEVEVQTEVEKTRPKLDDDGQPVLDEDGNEIIETYTETETSIERQPTGKSIKGVKYSILYMKAIKALQEAMQRIEQLEAKFTALEAN